MVKWEYAILTQTELGAALSIIFNVDSKYIVPKQGTWFNPQDAATIEANTWIAYIIKPSHPVVMPFLIQDEDGVRAVSEHITQIELQIVGAQAESLAQSISLWPLRQDVFTTFSDIGVALLVDDLGHYVPTTFIQDGLNSVIAYNTRFNVVSQIEIASDQSKLTSAAFTALLT